MVVLKRIPIVKPFKMKMELRLEHFLKKAFDEHIVAYQNAQLSAAKIAQKSEKEGKSIEEMENIERRELTKKSLNTLRNYTKLAKRWGAEECFLRKYLCFKKILEELQMLSHLKRWPHNLCEIFFLTILYIN